MVGSTFRRSTALGGALAVALYAGSSAAINPRPGVDWPQFRGIRANGVDETHPAPLTWNMEKNQGVVWKTPIPGLGHASPVVWGDAVYVSTAISAKGDAGVRVGLYGDIKPVEDETPHEWRLYALDKKSGAIRWQRTIVTGVPKIKRHEKATHANSTLATDGERIIAFLGSEGLYGFDMKGTPLWKKDLGVLDAGYFMVPEAQWGTASSPILHEGVAVVQADVQKGSFLAAFDASSGRELWRVPRNDVPTWSTPTVHAVNGRTQLIVNGLRHIGAYDFKTGEVIWNMKGLGDIPVPTPVVHDGFVYITNAHGPGAPVFAIRETATGDISLPEGSTTSAGVVWSYPRGGGYMATPLVYRGLLYVLNYNGALMVYDAKTGERKYQQRLADGTTAFTASPVAADGKVYMTSEDGRVFVLKAGPAHELLSTNEMSESTLATPALSEGLMIWRTQKHVLAIK